MIVWLILGPGGCHLSAIMIHDDSYKEPELTKDDQEEETKIKQKVFQGERWKYLLQTLFVKAF